MYSYIYIYIYICIYIYIYIYKIQSKNFWYILKVVTFMCMPWIAMFHRFINTKISK